jgi:tight adherence protein B
MAAAVITFIIVAVIVAASCAAIMGWPSLRRRTRIRERLSSLRGVRPGAEPLNLDLTRDEPVSQIATLARMLSPAGPLIGELGKTIAAAGLRISISTFVLASVFGGLLAAMAAQLVAAALPLTLLAWAAGTALPWLLVRRALRLRVRRLDEQFPEALDVIARALRAGHTLADGIGMAAEETPAPLGSEFRRLFEQQNYGPSFTGAIRAFADRVPVLEARLFGTAVLTQREVGGNLADVLDGLAAVTRDRFAVRRQVRTLTAHGRLTGWILACAAPALAAGMFLLNPEHPKVLLDDPIGLRMLAGAAVLQVVGTLLVRRIVDVEY